MITVNEVEDEDEDEYEELKNQIHINSTQLESLYVLSRTDTFNMSICIFILLLMLVFLCLLLSSFLFVDLEHIFREDIIEYSGSLVVFLIIGIINLVKFLFDTWLRKNKITFLIHQQSNAISYAEKQLNDNYL